MCPGSLTSRRDVLPAEPAAVPASSQVPLPQVPPKEPSTASASRLLVLCAHFRGWLLPGPPQAPQVPPLPAPELQLLRWWRWSAVRALWQWPGIWGLLLTWPPDADWDLWFQRKQESKDFVSLVCSLPAPQTPSPWPVLRCSWRAAEPSSVALAIHSPGAHWIPTSSLLEIIVSAPLIVITLVWPHERIKFLFPQHPRLSVTLLQCRLFCGRRKWQPTPVFLPGKSHGQRSLAGNNPWDHKRFIWASLVVQW